MPDSDTADLQAAPAAAAPSRPAHVILLDDWAGFLAGRVLAVDSERYAQIERDGAHFRPATEREVSLAGVAG